MEGNPQNSMIAFGAAIVAALIAGCFSFLNLVISKDQKVSEFRQASIDKLREEISQFIASINYIAIANKLWVAQQRPAPLDYYKAAEPSLLSYSQNYTSIVLRINPSDAEETMRQSNKEFLFTLKSMRDAVLQEQFDTAIGLIDTLREKAQPILKHEWERVKKGEPIYRSSLYVAATFVVIALLLEQFSDYSA